MTTPKRLLPHAIVTIAFAAGMATACSASASSGPQGDGGTTITEVRLSDGTRCAVMDSTKGKAISCGWGVK